MISNKDDFSKVTAATYSIMNNTINTLWLEILVRLSQD